MKKKDGLNQFGEPLAYALPVVFRCSHCGTSMLPTKTGSAPKRCTNRKTCNKMFHPTGARWNF